MEFVSLWAKIQQIVIFDSNLLAHATVDLIRVPGAALRQRDAPALKLHYAIGQIENGQRVNVGLGNLISQILDVVLTVKPDRQNASTHTHTHTCERETI